MYLTLTLNPSIDHFASISSINAGSPDAPSVNRCFNESFEGGGKGINVAKILHRLGAPVTASGIAAGFTGREIIRTLETEGIPSSFIEVPGNTRINLKLRDSNGIETEINGEGPRVSPDDLNHLIDVLNSSSFSTLFMSGSLPAGIGKDAYAVIMGSVSCSRIAVDTAGEALLNCLPLHPFLIKPNASELSALTGTSVNNSSPSDEIYSAASSLQDKGARNVLVSLGGNGACLLTEDGDFFSTPGIRGDVVSTIGAGDTMLSSFIYDLDKTGSAREALRFANCCAAACAFCRGLPSSSELSSAVKEFS